MNTLAVIESRNSENSGNHPWHGHERIGNKPEDEPHRQAGALDHFPENVQENLQLIEGRILFRGRSNDADNAACIQ